MFGREVRSDMVVVNSLFNIVYNFASYGLLDINKAFEGWVSGLLCNFWSEYRVGHDNGELKWRLDSQKFDHKNSSYTKREKY
jgi:hypothetical protein